MKKYLAIIGLVIASFIGWFVVEKPEPPFGAEIKTAYETAEDCVKINDINECLVNLNFKDISNLKSQEVAKITSVTKTTIGDIDIQIDSTRLIDGGVEVFVRAWDKNENKIGFGDGTVEIERFRIFNPRILVPDPLGSIIRTIPASETSPEVTKTYREDLTEAVKQTIAKAVKVAGKDGSKIVLGKVGNTTDLFYPEAEPGSTTVDGKIKANGIVYLTVHDAASGDDDNDATTKDTLVGQLLSGGVTYFIYRSHTGFDTSSLPDTDTIDSATLTMTSDGAYDLTGDNTWTVHIFAHTLSANTNLAAGDYNKTSYGATSWGSIAATDADIADGSAWSITLNSDGKTGISKTGVTNIGFRSTRDFQDNSGAGTAPTGAEYLQTYFADNAGTTNDPLLTVVHSAGGGAKPNRYIIQ